MNKNLLEKPKLAIEVKLAEEIGLNKAIVLKQIHYWLTKTNHVKNEEKWIYNTIAGWKKQFPFWSEKTISRILKDLKNDGFIKIEQLDKNLLNRTNWYTINYKKIDQFLTKLKIPPANIQNKSKDKHLKNKTNEGAELFEKFWNEYPRKIGKNLAEKEFLKLKEKEQVFILSVVKKYANEVETMENKYVKEPKTWLKDRYFEDYALSKSNMEKIDYITSLAKKIKALFDENCDDTVEIYAQMRGPNFIFEEKERKILKEINNTLDDYKEMEFKEGEIESYLRGILT